MIKYFICLILLFPIAAFPQAVSTDQIQNEEDLVSALLSRATEGKITSTVLRDHSRLVTKALFDRLISQADQFSSQDPAKSWRIYEVAREVADQIGDKKLVAYSSYKSGSLYFQQGNISQAKFKYLQSKETLEQSGRPSDLVVVLSGLANVCLYQEALKEAREYSQQSIALANSVGDRDIPLIGPIQYGVAVSWLNLGDLAKGEGHYDEALAYFQKALESFKALSNTLPQYRADVADSLAEIGRVYRVKGDHLAALRYFNQALEIAKTLNSKFKLAGVLNSIAVLYIEQSDYSKASEYTNQSLSVYRKLGDRIEIARLLNNQGVINQRQAKYEEALTSFQESLENSKGVDAPDLFIATQQGIGAVYQEQGDYRAALEWLDKALKMAQNVGAKTRQAELLWRSGEAYYLKGDFPKAIVSAGNAADLARQLRLPIISYLALTAKGKYYLAENNYDLAFQTLTQAIEQIETIRSQVAGQEQGRQIFFENKVAAYNLLVELLVRQKRPLDALFYAERAKGRVLFDVLRQGRTDLRTVMSEQEEEEDAKLNRDIAALNIRIDRESNKKLSDAGLLGILNEDLRAARLRYETFQNSFYASRSNPGSTKERTETLTVDRLNELVKDEKKAFLEYVVAGERTYLFCLTKKQSTAPLELKVYSININEKELSNQARGFRQMLADRDPTFAGTAHKIYDLLIRPAEAQLQGKDSVCIIPDGILWEVPFQATRPSDDRYLLQDYAIYYAPSLSVLRELSLPRKANKLAPSLLAFGNPRLANGLADNFKATYRGESLAPLPEAEAEVEALRDIWGSEHSRIFVGANAGKRVFKAEAGNFTTIHLATHGILDDRNPMYSRLVMARVDGDPDDDGLLEAREIMQLNLRANLVVLSACQTARGRIGAGEGVIGMSWAFFVAGVPTLVVSQWKVDSAATAALMISFHQQLAQPPRKHRTTKAGALRQAALDLLKQPKYRHPFYWAGFVMIGNGM